MECLVGKVLLVNPHTACGREGRLPEYGSLAGLLGQRWTGPVSFSDESSFCGWMGVCGSFSGRGIGCESFASLLGA